MADGELELLRASDLLTLSVQLTNTELANGVLRRLDPDEPAGLTLVLPPQHYREATDAVAHSSASQIAAGAPAKLEFFLPDGTNELPLPAGGLLGLCQQLGTARSSQIYLPARVFYQPLDARWTLGLSPNELDGRTDLWRAKLVGPTGDGQVAARFLLAAVLNASPEEDPGWDVTPRGEELFPRYFRSVMLAHRFDLSPWGASVRLRGPIGWGEDATVTAETAPFVDTYEHDTDFGRDTRVQLLTPGHLTSGHPATVVVVSRRVFLSVPAFEGGSEISVAGLIRETSLVVDDPVLRIDQLGAAYRASGREIPFRELHLVTPYVGSMDSSISPVAPFPVRDNDGFDVQFHLVGIDHAGQQVHLHMPLTFIPIGTTIDPASVNRDVAIGAQSLTITPHGSAPMGATSVTAHGLTVTAAAPQSVDPSLLPAGFAAPVLPTVQRMRVALDAASQFTGQTRVVTAQLHDTFLAAGLAAGANPLGAFLDLPAELNPPAAPDLPGPLDLAFSARDVGGLAKPDMKVGALTALKGAMPTGVELDQPPDPQQFLQQFAAAKILGFIDLKDLIDLAHDIDNPAEPMKPPELVQKVLGDRIELRYTWKAKLKKGTASSGGTGLEPAKAPPAGQPPSHLFLDAVVSRRVGTGPGGDTQSRVKGILHQVDLVVAGIVRVHFDSLELRSEPGTKTQVVPKGMNLTFEGELSFLDELTKALESSGLAKGASVDVTSSGITAGFSAAVPSLQVGMFAIANLAVDTRLRIPFDTTPATFRFAVAERHNPFSVTVSLFGGGGFFALELDTAKGINRIEASLEFGGAMSLNIVVASGGVYVMGGIYFLYDQGKVTVSGYLRCGGYLSVLGLVTVSVDFFMQLGYQPETGKVHGSASLTVGIEVLFFSKTVTLSIERTFAGSGNDPSFTDCFELEDWKEYCGAFA